MIDALLKYGANIDVRIDTKLGYTVLMKLASTDFIDVDRFDNIVEIIKFLIDRGANKNIKGYDQRGLIDVIKNTQYRKELIDIINDTNQTVFYSKNIKDNIKSNNKEQELDLHDLHDLRTNCCKIF